jgi:toxin FitB
VIVLDTNVVSALMRLTDEPAVATWADQQDLGLLHITTITLMELRYGIEMRAPGRKRTALERDFAWVQNELLTGRTLSFDEPAAEATGRWFAATKRAGRNIGVPDLQIAGIAIAHQVTLATRNLKNFVGCGVKIVNPWAN